MRRLYDCCFTSKPSKGASAKHSHSERSRASLEIPSARNADNGLHSERSGETMESPSATVANTGLRSDPERLNKHENISRSNTATNIILNHDFSGGLHSWHPNCCDVFVVSTESNHPEGIPDKLGIPYAVVTNRKECWQGLEQDITSKVSTGSTYMVSAQVGVSGPSQDPADVQATLKLEHGDSITNYLFIARKPVLKGCWTNLEGTFSLSTMPERVVFYLEGPLPGVDILITSVKVTCVSDTEGNRLNLNEKNARCNAATNIILNHDFSEGLHSWHPNCCDAFVVSAASSHPEGKHAKLGVPYVVVTNRRECWQGLEQDITSRVSTGSTYIVSTQVGVSGCFQGYADVQATLKLEFQNAATDYLFIGRKPVLKECWTNLEGTFSLSTMPDHVVFYLEGPSPGVDILIKSVKVSCVSDMEWNKRSKGSDTLKDENIILNPIFEDGLNNWSGRGCKVVLHDSVAYGKILSISGTKFFASAIERTQSWNGIQQEITGRVQRKLAYKVTAIVRIFGNNVSSADVRAALWVQSAAHQEQYTSIANVQATDKDWLQLQGKFLLNGSPSRVVIYLEGPPPGTDILLHSLIVEHAKAPPSHPPLIENEAFGVNIIANSNLTDGTNAWFPLGNCTLSVGIGSPLILPPMARDSLGAHEPLSNRYLLVTNRTQTWMGPAQIITEKVSLYLTYQVSAWVRTGPGATGPQNVNVALAVDNQWVNGGQVEINDDRWHEIGGCLRIEKRPTKVMVYVQGPAAGVDLMVAGLQIFPVDRHMRIKHLKRQTDKIRKRDVILKFSGLGPDSPVGSSVRIRQIQNSFPFGSCLSRTNIDNEDFVDFFIRNFNWAVFENELKWYWTEPQQGNFNYKDADELLDFCMAHNIQARGHCIFWEVENPIQPWIRALDKDDLLKAVQNRLTSLLTRYKGKFKHYDVNNEMMHGSFYQDRLGEDIRANMFKTANQLDPSSILFVNDYHVEDSCDTQSSPEKYIEHVLRLQAQGAPVGGLGIQGHIDSPVGPIVCSALDKLASLGLPIWFTELDVSSNNEYVRADDLEVMLREAFAHPAVEGIMLWGFWELFMSRENSHLVNAGEISEAGKRYLALKQEWLSHADGHIRDQGQFSFRGFLGSYQMEIVNKSRKVTKTFVVDKGEGPLLVTIAL